MERHSHNSSPDHTHVAAAHNSPPRVNEDNALLDQLERNSWMIQSALSSTAGEELAAAGSGKQAVLALKGKVQQPIAQQATTSARLLPQWHHSSKQPGRRSPKGYKGKGKRKVKKLKRLTKKDKYMAEAQAEALRLELEIRHRLKMEAKRWTKERKERRKHERQQARARTKALHRHQAVGI